MSSVEEIKSAIAKLNRLGDPDKIADYLERNGYKGVQQDPESCPIANYLHAETPNAWDIEVSPTTNECSGWSDGYIDFYEQEGDDEVQSVALGRYCNIFALNFDNGRYTDLIQDFDEDGE